MTDFRGLWWIPLVLLSLASVTFGQVSPAGRVWGRVKAVGAPDGVKVAHVSLVVHRGERDVRISEGVTDERGRFRLDCGPIPERPQLRVEALGLAPQQWTLKELTQGEGLLVPDLVLDKGVAVSMSVDAVLAAEAPVWILVFPLATHQRVIDLAAPPVLKARFDQEGQVTLPHVAPGLYGFVVTDFFSRFRPELVVWQVGHDSVDLPLVALRPGSAVVMELTARARQSISGQLVAGFGRWHPEGGEEYRFRRAIVAKANSEGDARIVLGQLPPSMCEIDLTAGNNISRLRTLPGSGRHRVSWYPGASVVGQITTPLNFSAWDTVHVRVGGRLARISKSGQFICEGLRAGSYRVYAFAPGFPAITHRRVVLADSEARRDFRLTFVAGTQVSGETRNSTLKRVPYTWVGFGSRDADPRFLGRYFQSMSDGAGVYDLRGLSAGRFIFYLRPARGFYSREDSVDLAQGVSARHHLRYLKAGRGGGKLLGPDKKPIANARVELLELPTPLSALVGDRAQARNSQPIVHQSMTNKEGDYSFDGLRPLRHALLFRPIGSAPEVAAEVEITVGSNASGFDWRIDPPPALFLDLPIDSPFRLRSTDHPFIDRWLYRPVGSGPVLVSSLERGLYRLEPLAVAASNWRLAKRRLNYVEWQRGNLSSLASVPAYEPTKVIAVPLLTLLPHEIRLFVGDELPGKNERVELTAYPLNAARPLQPYRLEFPKSLAKFTVDLPRGNWIIRARSARGARGATGPISIGRGFEDPDEEPTTLNLEAPATAIGFVDLVKRESEEDEGVYVSVDESSRDLIQPWRIPVRRVPLSETGEMRIDGIPSGDAVLRIFGPQAWIDVPMESRSFELKDLRRLVPGLPAALSLQFKPETLMDVSLEGASGSLAMSRRKTLLPGRYALASSPDWVKSVSTGVRSLRRVVDLRSGDIAFGKSNISLNSRVAMRGSIGVDAGHLRFWTIKLIPILSDAYDVGRMILAGRTDQVGAFRFKGIPSGDYAFRFDYRDEIGRTYQISLPLYLAPGSQVQKQDVHIRTRALTVLAYDEGNGEANENALVRILRTDLRGLGASTVFRRDIEVVTQGLADNTGEVIVRSLPIGTYDIEVSQQGRVCSFVKGLNLSEGSGPITVRAIAKGGSSVVVDLKDEESNPVVGAACFLFAKDKTRVHGPTTLRSNALGRVFLDDLKEGTYAFYMFGPGFPTQRLQDLVIEATDQKIRTRIAKKGADLAVSCVDEDGRAVQGVKVFVESETSNWQLFGPEATLLDERGSEVNAFGTLELRNIPQGECQLRAIHLGFETFTGVTLVRESKRNEFRITLKRNR